MFVIAFLFREINTVGFGGDKKVLLPTRQILIQVRNQLGSIFTFIILILHILPIRTRKKETHPQIQTRYTYKPTWAQQHQSRMVQMESSKERYRNLGLKLPWSDQPLCRGLLDGGFAFSSSRFDFHVLGGARLTCNVVMCGSNLRIYVCVD